MTRIVFMGTPRSAVPTLRLLSTAHDVGLVVTQPDRPRGRSATPAPPAVKEVAIELGKTVAQPTSGHKLLESLRSHGPFDLGVVVAYGRLLDAEVLAIPSKGILNVHFSLLPRWRGASPVVRALMAGDPMTGVTILALDEGLDTGPILTAQAVDIAPEENAGLLTSRLAELGARLLFGVIEPYLEGATVPVAQSDDGMTYAPKITKDERVLDGLSDPDEFVNRVRALSPKPGATLTIDGQPHKILEARPVADEATVGRWDVVHGKVITGVGGGAVEIAMVQAPGRTAQPGVEWARGRHADSGSTGNPR